MKILDCLELYADAAFYDAEFAERTHEIPFYVGRANAAGGPVLELACGTGRLTLPIAEAGIPITGVDIAPAMIDRAEVKARAAGLSIDWHLADIRSLDLGKTFELIFIAANALQHLHDANSLRAFFDSARRHLAPDGQLILDVFNPAIPKLARTLDEQRPHKQFRGPDGALVQVDVASEYLAESQILHFILTYRSEGRVVLTKDVRMRCFFPEELVALCKAAGFEVVERFGDYDGRAFSDGARQQILVCRARA